jgi:succinate dehydrogenase / fumarate reductase, flavoprotein subunit
VRAATFGAVDPQDSWQQHLADTLREGYLLGDPRTVSSDGAVPAR